MIKHLKLARIKTRTNSDSKTNKLCKYQFEQFETLAENFRKSGFQKKEAKLVPLWGGSD